MEGFPFSFGVFQVYYSHHEPFASEAANIAAIGTTATGSMYFALPFAAVIVQRWPKIRRLGMAVGSLVAVTALIAASFCNDVGSLIATQGAMYAVGGILAYCPTLQYIDGGSFVQAFNGSRRLTIDRQNGSSNARASRMALYGLVRVARVSLCHFSCSGCSTHTAFAPH